MSCYFCACCDNLIDGDWNVCTDTVDGLVCESCAAAHYDEDGEHLPNDSEERLHG